MEVTPISCIEIQRIEVEFLKDEVKKNKETPIVSSFDVDT